MDAGAWVDSVREAVLTMGAFIDAMRPPMIVDVFDAGILNASLDHCRRVHESIAGPPPWWSPGWRTADMHYDVRTGRLRLEVYERQMLALYLMTIRRALPACTIQIREGQHPRPTEEPCPSPSRSS